MSFGEEVAKSFGRLKKEAMALIHTKVRITDDPKITQDLWNAEGWCTDYRISDDRRGVSVRVFVKFDEPRKSIGATMIGVWVEITQIEPVWDLMDDVFDSIG